MAANSGKKPRGKGKPFEKGVGGNPRGRPKRTVEELDLIDACKAKTPAALAVIEGLMVNGERETTRLNAALAIIERGHGKPEQPVKADVSGNLIVEITRFAHQVA